MEENQNITNINGNINILPSGKLIICEVMFCGLATRVLTSS
jgi:hypothetical protein